MAGVFPVHTEELISLTQVVRFHHNFEKKKKKTKELMHTKKIQTLEKGCTFFIFFSCCEQGHFCVRLRFSVSGQYP